MADEPNVIQFPEPSGADAARAYVQDRRRVQADSVFSLDDDPDKAARALDLSEATGVPAEVIHPQLEEFEKQHRATLTSELISQSPHLQEYIASQPMASKVSNDDWTVLSTISDALSSMWRPTSGDWSKELKRTSTGSVLSAFNEGFNKGAGPEPVGGWAYNADHKLLSATASVLGLPIEIPFRTISGAIGGVSEAAGEAYSQFTGDRQTGENLKRDFVQLADQAMIFAGTGSMPMRGPMGPGEYNAKLRQTIDAAKPFVEAKEVPPVGVDPAIDKLHAEQAKVDAKNLDALFKEAKGSATRERNADLFADFIRQHTDAKVGISAEAVRKLYGDKPPRADDNLLGWQPDLVQQMTLAEATGGDVRVSLADLVAKTEPDVLKDLTDHIRVRDGGLTLEESKNLKPMVEPAQPEPIEGQPIEPVEPSDPAVDGIRRAARLEPKPLEPVKAKAGDQLELPQAGTTRVEDRKPFAKGMAIGLNEKQYAKILNLIERQKKEDQEYLAAKFLEEEKRKQGAEYKTKEAEVRSEVVDQLRTRPDIAADIALREPGVGIRADKLTEEQKAALPKNLVLKDGIDPDDLALRFGYNSGDRMVEDLITLNRGREASGMKPDEYMRRLIKVETDARMDAEFGDRHAKALEAATDHVLSQTTIDYLHEETLRLATEAGVEFSIGKEALAAAVRIEFAKYKVGDVTSKSILANAGRAGKAILDAFVNGDAAEAFRQQQKQYVATLMAKEAVALEKLEKQFQNFAKRNARPERKSVAPEYMNYIHQIMLQYGLKVGRSLSAVEDNIAREGTKSLNDFVQSKIDTSGGLNEIPIAEFLLDGTAAKSIDELSVAEFKQLKDSLTVLEKLGRDEQKVITQGNAFDLRTTINTMSEKLREFPLLKRDYTLGRHAEKKKLGESFIASMINTETLLNRWDKNDPRGVFNQTIVRPLTERANYESKLNRDVAHAMQALSKIEDIKKAVESPLIDPGSITPQNPSGSRMSKFTRGNVLAMLQNAGNDSNWFKLAKGYGADPAALMEWLINNTTKEDWARAQKMGDTVFKPLFKEAQQNYHNRYGIAPEAIELVPIANKHGTFEGWYHPLIKDPIDGNLHRNVRETEVGPIVQEGRVDNKSIVDPINNPHATTANGYTKSRSKTVYPLDLTFEHVPGRIAQMVHDIAMRDVVLETDKIFGDKGFQKVVTQHYGKVYADGLRSYLRDVAGNADLNTEAYARAAKLSETVRQNVISTYIGFNPYTAAKHGPTAAIMSSREVGTTNFLKTFGEVAPAMALRAVRDLFGRSQKIGNANVDFAMKYSEELQRRERHWQDTIGGQHADIYGKGTLREKVIEKGSWLVAQSDMMSALPTWLAKYRDMIEGGADFGQAVFEADRAVRRAHGSTAITNQPGIVRGGGPVHGWLTSIYGFFGTNMQRRVELAHAINDAYKMGREGEIAAAAKKMPDILAQTMVYVVWPTLVEEWVTGMTTDDRRGWGEHLLTGAAMGLGSTIIYLRDIIHATVTGHDPGVGLVSSLLHDFNNAIRDLKHGKKAFDKQHAGKTVQDLITVYGEWTGKAPKAVGSAARGLIDYGTGQAKPKSFTEWRMLTTRGQTKMRVEK